MAFPEQSNPEFFNISKKPKFKEVDIGVAGLRGIGELNPAEKILTIRDQVYGLNEDELKDDPKKLRNWTKALFVLLDELEVQRSPDFDRLFSEIENILTTKQYGGNKDKISTLLEHNPFAQVKLLQIEERVRGIEKAIQIAETIVAHEPTNYAIKGDLGILYSRSNRQAEGVRLVEEAVKNQPSLRDPATHLASVYIKEGRLDDAFEIVEKIRSFYPDYAPVGLQLVNIYCKMNRLDEALKLCIEEVKKHPNKVHLKHRLVALYHTLGRDDEAASLLAEIKLSNPKVVIPESVDNVRKISSSILQEETSRKIKAIDFEWNTGSKKKAIKAVEEMVDTASSVGLKNDMKKKLVTFFWKSGRKDDAMKLVDEMVKESPGSVDVRLQQARLYIESDRTTEAINILKEAMSRVPSDLGIKHVLINSYFKLDRYKEAGKVLETIHSAESARTSYFWIKYYYGVGDLNKAFQKCVEFLQSSHSTSGENHSPMVLAYLYRINPHNNLWEALDTPEIREVLKLPAHGKLVKWIQKNFIAKDFKSEIEKLEARYASSGSIFNASFLIPVNHAASEGLANYGLEEALSQGTKLISEKSQHGKVKRLDPNTKKEIPDPKN